MDLFVLIAIIVAISKAFGKKDQKAKKAQPKQKQMRMDAYYRQRFAGKAGKAAPEISKAATQPAPAMMPARPVRSGPIQPRVHAHLAPDCDEHDKPGSLGETSLEGKDMCHEDQLAPKDQPRPVMASPEVQPGLELEWTGENMVKAFVMQEVLTRPCDRRRRA